MVSLSSVVVREAGIEDVPMLAELSERTYRETFSERDTPEELECVVRETRSATFFSHALLNHRALIAEVGGVPVGYTLFGPVNQTDIVPQEGDRELVRLYVLASHQGRGVGRALMDATLAHPTMVHAPRIYLDVWQHNHRALTFYRKYGFSDTSIHNGDHMVMVRTHQTV